MYRLHAVTKTYRGRAGDVPALSGVNFEVARGERVALLGPSGAGKTSIFRLLNATLRPTSGTVHFDGRDIGMMSSRELRALRCRVGTIFQRPQLVPQLGVLENAALGRLGCWSLARTLRSAVRLHPEDRDRAHRALAEVELSGKERARTDELSGGEQQRLAIARVLVQEPEVVLADEPFASLDPTLTSTTAQLLVGLIEQRQRALVATLHDVELALRFFPRIIGIRGGRVAFDCSAVEVSAGMLEDLYAGERREHQGGNSERDDGRNGQRARAE